VSERPREEREHARFLTIITAIVVLGLWLRPIFSSYWLDETATRWVIDGGWAETARRAFEYQQSPFYYLIARAMRVLGESEWIIRVPSLVAYAGSAILVHRLARRWFGDEVARLAVLVFAGSIAAFAASDARPYATAIFFTTAAAVALVAWLDGGRWTAGVIYVVASALCIWAHYLFGLALLAHVPYAFVRTREAAVPVRRWLLVAAWAMIGLLITPLISHLLALNARRGTLVIPATATTSDVFYAIATPILAVPIVVGCILVSRSTRVTVQPVAGRGSPFHLLIPWAVLPPWILLAISALTEVKFLQSRYAFSAAPALAILGAWVVASLEPAAMRRIIAGLFAILAAASFVTRFRGDEDWRGAMAVVAQVSEPGTVILGHPGLVESQQVDWLTDPERASYLLAPFTAYPVAGDVIAMPLRLDVPGAVGYVADIVDRRLVTEDRFLVLTRDPSVPFQEWLDGRLGDDGWSWRSLGTFGVIEVFEFTRGAPSG
jgi:4-amino-4-deoxy-L-arabinose transferase-like glycosyltransferase